MLTSSAFGILRKFPDMTERWYQGYNQTTQGMTNEPTNNYFGIKTITPNVELDVNGEIEAVTGDFTNLEADNFTVDTATITTATITYLGGDLDIQGYDLNDIGTAQGVTLDFDYLGADLDAQDYNITDIGNLEADDITASATMYSPIGRITDLTSTTASITYLGSNLDAQDYDITDVGNLEADDITASATLYSPIGRITQITATTANITYLGANLDAQAYNISDIGTAQGVTLDFDYLGANLDAQDYDITDIGNLEADDITASATIYTPLATITNLYATNLESSLDGTGYDLTIADINASGTVTANLFAGNIESNYVQLPDISGATYTDLTDMFNTRSAGKISGGDITDNGDGTIDVAAGTGLIKSSDSDIGAALLFDWSASSNIDLTDDSVNYILVQYNGGSPQIAIETDFNNIDFNTEFVIGYTYARSTTHLDFIEAGNKIPNYDTNNCQRLFLRGIERMTGAVIAEKATRYITATAGIFYLGDCRITTSAQDTQTDEIEDYWYYNGSAWINVTGNTQIDNTNYNDTTSGLTALTANRYGVHWIYMCLEGDINVLYGQGNYTKTQAEEAQIPSSIPDYLSKYAILIGKVVIKKSASTFTSIQSALNTTFTQASPSDHNDLSNLQGGAADEYYHFDATEFGYLDGQNQSVLTTSEVTFVTANLTDLIATNLEGDLNGTGFDLTIADISASGTITANTLTDGTASIIGGVATGFTSITSTTFVGNLTGTATTANNTDTLDYLDSLYFTNASNLASGTLPDARLTGEYTITTLNATDIIATLFQGNLTGTATTANNSDTLDYQHGSYYQNADNLNAGTLLDARLTGNYNVTNLSVDDTVTASYFVGDGSQLTGIVASALPDTIVTQNYNYDFQISSSNALYLGDRTVSGSWRIMVSGNYLVVERQESGAWNTKGEFQP